MRMLRRRRATQREAAQREGAQRENALGIALIAVVLAVLSAPAANAAATATPPDAAVTPDRLRVVLLMDTSGSMAGEAMAGARAAAHTFSGRLPADAQLALLSFSTEPQLAADFTAPRADFAAAIDRLQPNGETALYDAIAVALHTLGSPQPREQQILVVLSDGGDTVSAQTLDQITAQLGSTNVRVVMVELATSETDRNALEALVHAAQGTLLSTPDPAALSALYDGIAAELTEAARTPAQPRTAPSPPAQMAYGPFGTVMRPSFLASPPAYVIALIALGMALVLIIILSPTPDPVRFRKSRRDHNGRVQPADSRLSSIAAWATRTADDTLERHRWGNPLNRRLEDAGIDLRPGEFVVLASLGVMTFVILGALLAGSLAAAVAGGLAVMGTVVVLNHLVRKRRARFADQLSDTLGLLAGSLRAGHSLLQAIDAVAREADKPTSQEFRRLVVETRLGRPLSTAVSSLADRMESPDFRWVSEAIIIHRDVGGDLSQILDRAAATIRERNQIRRQAKALSAEGRLSAIILTALPFLVTGFVSMTNPSYLQELTSSAIGLSMLATGVILLTVGGLWLKRIVKVVF